jgi:hypothetical protein
MGDRPDGAELLQLARAALLGELLPELPEARRYEALMIANAIGMAQRELEAARRGTALTSETPAEPDALARRLAEDVRDGKRDGNEDTYRALLEACVDRVGISKPRALALVGRAPDD